MYIECVWEPLHVDSFCGYKSRADTLVASTRAEPGATSAAPVCLSYCDISPLLLHREPPSSNHFHPDATL